MRRLNPQDLYGKLLGVGTPPDPAYPVSAKLNDALFVAKPTGEGGTGDIRHRLSKQAVGNTASLLFEDALGDRAELGLIGSDDVTIRVHDGTAWKDALQIARTTQAVVLAAALTVGGVVTAAGFTTSGAVQAASGRFVSNSPDVVSVLSGSTALYAGYSLGRAAAEWNFGIVGTAASSFITGSAAGNLCIVGGSTLLISTNNSTAQVTITPTLITLATPLTVSGAINATKATFTGPNTDAVAVLSGGASANAGYALGRTGYEWYFGIAGSNGAWVTGSAPGNAVIYGGSTLLVTVNNGGAVQVTVTPTLTYVATNLNVGGNVNAVYGSLKVGNLSAPVNTLHVADTVNGGVGKAQIIAEGVGGGYGAGISMQSVLTGGGLAEMANITADSEGAWGTSASTQTASLRFRIKVGGTLSEYMRVSSARRGTLYLGDSLETALQLTNFGYSAGYRVIRVGTTDTCAIALGYDPNTNAGGSFGGPGQVIISNSAIIAPNAAGNDWMGVMRATGGKVYVGGSLSGEMTGDALVIDAARNICHGTGADIVIDNARIFRLRSYTVATLPAAGVVGRLAMATDLAQIPSAPAAAVGGGTVKGPVVDNGTAWFTL